MICKSSRELLSAYADGQLGQDERGLIEEHLGSCGVCRTILADYVETARQISGLRSVPTRTDITGKTMARIEAARANRWKPAAWQMAGVGAILAALIVGLVIGIPLLGGKTDFALAAEKIVRNSEAFKTVIAGEGEVTLEGAVEGEEDKATLTFATEKGKEIVAQVDLKAERVIELKIFGLKIELPPNPESDLELSQAQREEAIAIAITAPSIKEFIAKGIDITHVFGHTYDGKRVADVGIIPGGGLQGVTVIDGYYMIDGKSVRVDLDEKEVMSVTEFGITVDASRLRGP